MQFNVWLYSRFQQSPLSNFRLVTEIKGKNVKSNRLIWSAARYWCLSRGCHNVLYVMDRALLIIEHAALFKHKLTQWFGAVSIAPLECWKPTLLLLPFLWTTGGWLLDKTLERLYAIWWQSLSKFNFMQRQFPRNFPIFDI